MFKMIKDFFSKEEKNEEMTAENLFPEEEVVITKECSDCELKDICMTRGNPTEECAETPKLENFNPEKDSILIIDDHEGMVSFLKDDIEYFHEQGYINMNETNIIALTGSNAAFVLEALYKRIPTLNIKWAIIDITLGGSKMRPEGNVKYTGVDVFEMIYKRNKDFRFLFYTGNNLNPYIKSNEKLIEQFRSVKGDNIKKYVLFKTSMDINKRRSYIIEHIFKK